MVVSRAVRMSQLYTRPFQITRLLVVPRRRLKDACLVRFLGRLFPEVLAQYARTFTLMLCLLRTCFLNTNGTLRFSLLLAAEHDVLHDAHNLRYCGRFPQLRPIQARHIIRVE